MMFDRYEKILSESRKADLEKLSSWYQLFRLREDPFLAQIVSDEIDFFVNRERIIDRIVFDVGVASRGIPITIFLSGPSLSGKTAILQYTYSILEHLKAKKPEEYEFDGEFLQAEELFQADSDLPIDDQVQSWVAHAGKKLDYLFVDSATPEQVLFVLRKFIKTNLRVISMSPHHLNMVLGDMSIEPKSLFLEPFSITELKDLLTRRLLRVSEKHVDLEDFFHNDSLRTISKYSFGVPGLALRCASRCLHLLRNLYTHGPSAELGESLKVTQKIAFQACRIEKCVQAAESYPKLSEAKRRLIREVMNEGRSPTELSSLLRKDRTTISRQLMDLKKEGLVIYKTRGRESIYKATLPVKVLYEISELPEGVWSDASA